MEKERPSLFYLQLFITIIFAIAMFGFENNPNNLLFLYLRFPSLFALGIVTLWSGWRVTKGKSSLSIYKNNEQITWLNIITGLFVSIFSFAKLLMIIIPQ